MAKEKEFHWRRLHSLLGLIPVGLFLTFHLLVNFQATKGVEAFNDAAGLVEKMPFLLIVEWVVIYIPLMFHAFYGVYIAFTAKPNLNRFGTLRNWFFVLQRFTGIFLVIFIAWHIWETRVQKALHGTEVNFDMMAEILSNPAMVVFYILGIISATFHLSNGIWSFLVSWGITQSKQSQKVATWVTMIFFVLLSVVGVMAILAFV